MSELFTMPTTWYPQSSGQPYPYAKLYFYRSGTTTDQAVYQDPGLSVAHTQPVVADSAGIFPVIYLDTSAAYDYRVQLKTSTNVIIRDLDNIPRFALTTEQLGQLFYPICSAEISAAVTPYTYCYPCGDIRRYGAKVDGVTADDAAINYAISVAYNGLGFVYFPAGTTAHAATLIFKNGVTYAGDGASANGSILRYVGNADQIQVNNPSNSSTAAYINVQDLWLKSANNNTGKANFADNGSTFLNFTRVRFSGARINLILDQSEIVRVRDCLFQDILSVTTAAGVWIVNGATRTGGNSTGYTNEILFEGCQFNCDGTANLPTLIADDGGLSHKVVACNFNGGAIGYRATNVLTLSIKDCEIEAGLAGTAYVTGVGLYSTTWAGGTGGVTTTTAIRSNLISSGAKPSIVIGDSSAWSVSITDNTFNTTSTTIDPTGVQVELIASGNEQINSGDNRYKLNNHFSSGQWTPTWTGSVSNPSLGNGERYTSYSRKGKEVTLRMNQTFGSTTSVGSGTYSWTTPVAAAADQINFIGNVMALCAGSAPATATPYIANNSSTMTIRTTGGSPSNYGSSTPGSWTTNDYIQIAITYKAANWLG